MNKKLQFYGISNSLMTFEIKQKGITFNKEQKLDQPHMTTVSLDQKISEFTKLIQSTLNSILI